MLAFARAMMTLWPNTSTEPTLFTLLVSSSRKYIQMSNQDRAVPLTKLSLDGTECLSLSMSPSSDLSVAIRELNRE